MPDAYQAAGVDYETLDAAKRSRSRRRSPPPPIPTAGARLDDGSRGRAGGRRSSIGADAARLRARVPRDEVDDRPSAYEEATGRSTASRRSATTPVAAVVNDCICVGALPVVVNAYFATGSAALLRGDAATPRSSRGSPGPARTPARPGRGGVADALRARRRARRSTSPASAVGRRPRGRRAAPRPGARAGRRDRARRLHRPARQRGVPRPAGRRRRCPSGLAQPPGERRELRRRAPRPRRHLRPPRRAPPRRRRRRSHYPSHVTGHGLRKLMRADRELTYRRRRLPEVPEVLAFLAGRPGSATREAYGTLNMGVGFALYVAPARAGRRRGRPGPRPRAVVAGEVEAGPRRVVLEPDRRRVPRRRARAALSLVVVAIVVTASDGLRLAGAGARGIARLEERQPCCPFLITIIA